MSLESARAFVDRFKKDEEFRQSLQDADQEKVRAILEAEGFEFTEEEYDTARSELSDEELDAVAGGGLLCDCVIRICSGVFGF